MKSTNQTLRSHSSDTHAQMLDRTQRDMAVYLRRGHKARSEAFYSGLSFLGRQAVRFLGKAAAAGEAIHTWLFTPFYSGGRKS